MAVTVIIPTALRQYAGGQSEISVEARTAGGALEQLTAAHAELRRHLYNDRGELRNFVNVYVGDEDIRHAGGLSTPVKDGDTVMIVPAIAGGVGAEERIGAATDSGRAAPSNSEGADNLPALSNAEVARYSRHLIMPEVGMEGQRRLKAARVLLIGTGGLGSPASLYLAAAGVGTLGVVDFDVVDASN
ncbi:MAG TPA: ThiF family adenylyltransferase, partial [Pyrinomonadaceae bacterium]|nr:ThiF family adenylyltransferase [Pyrinomonadaceae bacterium]